MYISKFENWFYMLPHKLEILAFVELTLGLESILNLKAKHIKLWSNHVWLTPNVILGSTFVETKHKFNMCLEQRFLGKSRQPESLVL